MWRRKARRHWLGRRAKSLRAVASQAQGWWDFSPLRDGALGAAAGGSLSLGADLDVEVVGKSRRRFDAGHPATALRDDRREVVVDEPADPAAHRAEQSDRDEDPRLGARLAVGEDAARVL